MRFSADSRVFGNQNYTINIKFATFSLKISTQNATRRFFQTGIPVKIRKKSLLSDSEPSECCMPNRRMAAMLSPLIRRLYSL